VEAEVDVIAHIAPAAIHRVRSAISTNLGPGVDADVTKSTIACLTGPLFQLASASVTGGSFACRCR
jgi:hypothetical protein